MNLPRDHHFVPVFYLRQWCGLDGKLAEFKRIGDRFLSKLVGPKGTGYERDLYSFPELTAQDAHHIEAVFLHYADNIAARALNKHLTGDRSPWTAELRSAWSRFLLGMHMRHPDPIQELRESIPGIWDRFGGPSQTEYEKIKEPGWPDKFDEFLITRDPLIRSKVAVNMLVKLLDNDSIGTHINHMHWSVIDLQASRYRLCTSDRPLQLEKLKQSVGFASLPISPTKLFVATNNVATANNVRRSDPDALARSVNLFVVSRARRYAYSQSQSDGSWMEQHFGVARESTPFFPSVAAGNAAAQEGSY